MVVVGPVRGVARAFRPWLPPLTGTPYTPRWAFVTRDHSGM